MNGIMKPEKSRHNADAEGEPGRKRPFRGRGRPTREEGRKLQEHLLNVAAKEFLRKGYSATTVDAISARSRVTKMTIYRHFPSKERLFRAVVFNIHERFRNDFEKISQKGRPVEVVIRDFVTASYDDPASEDILGITRIVIAEATSFPDLAYTIYAQRREMMRPLTEYLTRMQEEKILHFEALPELAAFQLVALASGGIRVLMVPREAIEKTREVWIEAALRTFLDGTRRPV